MKNRRNYYRILHVQPDAPVELIKASYRTLMHKMKHHPDLGGDHETAVIINEAYDTLTDTKKRKAYDAKLFAERNKATMGQQSVDQRQGSATGSAHKTSDFRAAHKGKAHVKPKSQRTEAPPKDDKFDPNQSPEERAMPRVKLGALVEYYFEEQPKIKHQGTIIDFSPSGLQIQIENPVPINGKIRLRSKQLTAKALVSYCKPFGRSRWRIGVILLETKYSQRQGGFFRGSA